MFSGKKIKLLSDKDFYEPVGKRFEAIRLALCLTREQLAAKLNVSIKAVEDIENGETLPDLYLLKYLNKEYGLNINWMITGKGDVILNQYETLNRVEEIWIKKLISRMARAMNL